MNGIVHPELPCTIVGPPGCDLTAAQLFSPAAGAGTDDITLVFPPPGAIFADGFDASPRPVQP